LKTQPLRQDKRCLNCGTEVPERYCTHCGQENAVPHESFGHLVKHFIGDVLHYDSQFLTTLKYLLFRPGRLTREYMAGKRVMYVNPIKLYIFISFLFFLVFASLNHSAHHDDEPEDKKEHAAEAVPSSGHVSQTGKDTVPGNHDSVYRYRPLREEPAHGMATVTPASVKKKTEEHKKEVTAAEEEDNRYTYRSLAAYDSAQKALPPDERAAGFEGWITRRALSVGGDFKEGELQEAINHNAPKMMFILLPLFALWMKILYRKRYYADHAIFALHVHCFAFVVLLIAMLLNNMFVEDDTFTLWGLLLIAIYIWLALKNTYQQSYRRSFLKTMLLLTGYGISFAIVFGIFVAVLYAVIL
jgi:hypothetical protein